MDTKYQKISAMSEKIDGETHWFDENGRTISGWKYSNGWYYYNQKGVMQTGWQEINGSRYYMNESGVMQTGWQYIAWHLVIISINQAQYRRVGSI